MITLAQIGCGYWGPNLLRNFSTLPGARVKYVVETSPARQRYVTDRYPATQVVTSTESVYRDPEVTAVIIATPAQTHFSLASLALQAGRHVLVEKPLAMSVAEVDILASLADKKQLTLMAGHTFLYNPAVLFLKELIDSGELGRIYYLYAQRLNLGVVRSDVNALWNLAPHDVSIFNFLLGSPPLSVAAHGTDYLQKGIQDVVFGHLEYPNQIRASFQVSWLDPNKVRKVTLVGSRRMAVYDDMAKDKIAIYDKGIDSPGAADGGSLPFDHLTTGQLVYRSGDVRLPPLPATEPLQAAARDFVEAVADRRPPRSGAQSGRDVVATLQAASLSLKENSRQVRLAEIFPRAAP